MARNTSRQGYNWVEWEINLLINEVKIAKLSGKPLTDVFEEVAIKIDRKVKGVESYYYQIILPTEKDEAFHNMKPGETFSRIKRNKNSGLLEKQIFITVGKNEYLEELEKMKKTIILKDRGPVQMTYEEVLEQFDSMIQRFAYHAIEKILFNKPDKEEVIQELQLQTWIAYKRYNGKNAFSTYLHYYLQGAIHRSTFKLFAQKRTNTAGVVSLNQAMGGDDAELELEGLLGEEDMDICSLAFREFLESLEKKLDSVEKQILRVLMDKSDFTVQDLADKLGMSRQGANKKVNKFKEKMAVMLVESGFAS
jgi:RNA polymerase sigma factor (sigma-70 family)